MKKIKIPSKQKELIKAIYGSKLKVARFISGGRHHDKYYAHHLDALKYFEDIESHTTPEGEKFKKKQKHEVIYSECDIMDTEKVTELSTCLTQTKQSKISPKD